MIDKKPHAAGIDLNEQFARALHLMEDSDHSVFITGRAGTGKSTLLTLFRTNTRKKVAVIAPTGVAALNVQGQTIHSFFGFKPNITLDRIKRLKNPDVYRKLDSIIIDEISMVRADLLDCVDRFLRLNGPDGEAPFGGIQMIFIGDLYQLPPVVTAAEKAAFESLYETPYFYSARCFSRMQIDFVELEKVYRQREQEFIDLLNAIRNNTITDEGLAVLNQRCIPDFEPPKGQMYVYLTTTNEMASQINEAQLVRLATPLHTFSARIQGNFGDEYLPTRTELQLKVGAQIMMLNNDAEGRWVNGTIGEVTGIVKDGDQWVVIAALSDGQTVDILPFTWEIFRFFVAEDVLQSETVGRFTQYPLMLAWAITIHKSQGKTFDRVILDIGRGAFAHGQTYVALSRCRTLDGLVLKRPLRKSHVRTDYRVMRFLTGHRYQQAADQMPVEEKAAILKRAAAKRLPVFIVYLSPKDEKTTRTIIPKEVGEMEYEGKTYLGVHAFCLTRREERTFRVDRILDMRPPEGL